MASTPWDSDDEVTSIGPYTLGKRIGEGTYGTVYDGLDTRTETRVVIKLLQHRTEQAIGREIEALKAIQNIPYCISIKSIERVQSRVYIIMSYCPYDLEQIIHSTTSNLPLSLLKSYMYMLCTALTDVHEIGLCHRDLKPNNIMINENGHIAIIDFGMSRQRKKEEEEWTCQVVTRSYRPPELLFGMKQYDGRAVDMWSMGCIFAEGCLRKPFFSGKTDIDQLGQIFHAVGPPTEENWPGVTSFPFYLAFDVKQALALEIQFPMLTPSGLDLLKRMLTLDPSQRISAKEALEHDFFKTEPMPVAIADVPTTFQMQTKRKRNELVSPEVENQQPSSPNATSRAGRRIKF